MSKKSSNKGKGKKEGFVRVRFPKKSEDEVLGVIEAHHGSKLEVRCVDGHTRTCRIPGKIKYKLRAKPGDVVLIEKWPVQEDEKGDYLYQYKKNQVKVLINKGLISKEFLEKSTY